MKTLCFISRIGRKQNFPLLTTALHFIFIHFNSTWAANSTLWFPSTHITLQSVIVTLYVLFYTAFVLMLKKERLLPPSKLLPFTFYLKSNFDKNTEYFMVMLKFYSFGTGTFIFFTFQTLFPRSFATQRYNLNQC